MKFIDQLKAEVKIHRDMETDFLSRRYHQAKHIAEKYMDLIKEEARIAARNGDYEHIEGHAVIKGFIPLNEKDFDMPFVVMETKRDFWTHKKRNHYSLTPNNELFEVFQSAFYQLCVEEDIIYFPFQAQIAGKDGSIVYHTIPLTIMNPKKEKIQALGFPYQIEL
ncbi:MAG: hypothetical protein MJ071_01695 [Oscillospiraceae bacterium]|nr:hypothetical protein [Oscillospiraceae bacterium]